MNFKFADVDAQFKKDPKLQKEQVIDLVNWTESQETLPTINELQAILFLHSCHYNVENAKLAIGNFYKLKLKHSDIFKNRNPLDEPIATTLEISLISTLPKPTPDDDTILIMKFMDLNPEKFNFASLAKLFDMVSMLHFHSEGISNEFIIIVDYEGVTLSHLTKMGPLTMKHLITYLQDAMPVRLRGLHFVNTVSFMDKILAMMQPFMKKELFELIHLHHTVNDMIKIIPVDCLPQEYGGPQESFHILHDKIRAKLLANVEFFQWEDSLIQ